MKTAIALGTFDGLHKGHRAVLKETIGFYSIAVTFDLPPKSVISNQHQLLVLPNDRKKRLEDLGINQVVMQCFNDVKYIEPLNYLKALKERYNPSRIVCGFNYRFGKAALGDTDLLKAFCSKNGIELVVIDPVEVDGEIVSSTAIRNYIKNGDMQKASQMIYGGFKFSSIVLHGDARGRTIGFPTANQLYPEMLATPKFGVYLSRITIDGIEYNAITNVGHRPTFETDKVYCETYIKNFEGNLYDKDITLEFLSFIRPEQKFSSIEELKAAILKDIEMLN